MDFFLGWAKNHMKIFVVVSNRFFFFKFKTLTRGKKITSISFKLG